MIPDPIAVALVVAEVLEQLGVPYLIGGSVASSVWGEPRATEDVDMVADLRKEHVARLVAALQDEFYIAEEAVRQAVERGTCFNVIHLKRIQKVDVFVAQQDGLGREEMRRRQRIPLAANPDRSAFLATPEDTVLQKLAWYRKGDEASDRQWRDVLGVLKVQAGRLDRPYLLHWARESGLETLLRRAMTETGLVATDP